MKLIASVIIRNEAARYLELCVAHLLEFCDEVRIVDDGSTDGWAEALQGAWGKDGRRVIAQQNPVRIGLSDFHRHAESRNALLQFTLAGWPDWILDIDADEFVSDGAALRKALEGTATRLSLTMEEIWEAHDECLCVREDGGWRSHEVMMLWKPDMARRADLRILDKGPATGRTPEAVARQLSQRTGVQVLHFGWTNVAERQERYERYVKADGGRFHAGAHLQSIMWPDELIQFRARPWPDGMEAMKRRFAAVAV